MPAPLAPALAGHIRVVNLPERRPPSKR